MDVGLVALALAAVLLGATLQRVSGMGMALIVAPTLVLLLGPTTGVLLTNATALVSAALVLLAVRRDVDWRRYALMVPAAVVGAVPGALVVRATPAAWLEIIVGGLILLGLLSTTALGRAPRAHGTAPTLVAGAAGGFLNTTAGVAGPALVIYATATRWEQHSFRATLQPTFMTMAAISLVAKGALGATGPGGLPALVVGRRHRGHARAGHRPRWVALAPDRLPRRAAHRHRRRHARCRGDTGAWPDQRPVTGASAPRRTTGTGE